MSRDNSNQAEHSCFYTTEEIKDLNIPLAEYITEIPEPKQCQFCGKTLYHQGALFMGKIMSIMNKPMRCDCEAAISYWEKQDAIEQERLKKEQQEKEAKELLEKFKRAGIDKRHIDCAFNNYRVNKDNPQQVKAYEQMKNYLLNYDQFAKQGRGLYVEGTYGTGKTHLVTAIAKERVRQGDKVRIKTPTDLLLGIRSSFDSKNEDRERDIIQWYQTIDLLILDDFGKQKTTEWGMAVLYEIINYRYAQMLPTIITTNFNETSLIEALSSKDVDRSKIESIISRLHETTDVVTMAWIDFRG